VGGGRVDPWARRGAAGRGRGGVPWWCLGVQRGGGTGRAIGRPAAERGRTALTVAAETDGSLRCRLQRGTTGPVLPAREPNPGQTGWVRDKDRSRSAVPALGPPVTWRWRPGRDGSAVDVGRRRGGVVISQCVRVGEQSGPARRAQPTSSTSPQGAGKTGTPAGEGVQGGSSDHFLDSRETGPAAVWGLDGVACVVPHSY